ncbi:MAG: hypothetical protein JW787_11235 [Sedimentisphaerales bacterium]|nr:hypothetical protein [Sedimentisphaerales bacterium]
MQTQEIMSEDKAADSDESRLVPVTESIRYRKRAQSAEKKVEELTELLSQSQKQASSLNEQLNGIRTEQKLTQKLIAAGTVDVESAVLVAKAKMNEHEDTDVDDVIEQLKKDKQYLFKNTGENAVSSKTSGAKNRTNDVYTVLANAARKAANSGSRKDLQEYLKARRNYL